MSENEPKIHLEPVEFAEKFLENKTAELELAAKELEHSVELSKISIAAKERDRNDERRHRERIWGKVFWLALAGIAAVAVFGVFALQTDNASLLKELGANMIISITSFFAGYGFRRYRERSNKDEE